MQSFFKILRLVLPVFFFGYGVVANYSAFQTNTILVWPSKDLLSGGLTRDFEHDYKKTLPHFDTAFGIVGALRYASLGETRSGAVLGKNGWLFTDEETRLSTDTAVPHAVNQILSIQAQLTQRGAVLVLLPIPAKIDIAQPHAKNSAVPQNLAQLYTQFVQAARAQGVTVADARAAMLAAQGQVFFATDTHWTRLGAQIAAQELAQTLPQGTQSYQFGAEQRVQVTGDLVRYVTTDRFAPRIGLPPEEVIRKALISNAASQDIFAQSATDIVLIGTSYSANTDWGFADEVMFALQRDVVNLSAAGLGPVQPMRDYLAVPVQKGSADAPRVVIWEFPIRYLTDPALWDAPPATPARTAPSQVVSNG